MATLPTIPADAERSDVRARARGLRPAGNEGQGCAGEVKYWNKERGEWAWGEPVDVREMMRVGVATFTPPEPE